MSNLKIQQLIHRLEEGNLGYIVKLLVMILLGLGVLVIVVFDPMYWSFFRGLSHAKGMEQATIAREIARGNGYQTRMVRPLAVTQIEQHLEAKGMRNPKEVADRLHYDTYHAPLWSYTLAPTMKVMKSQWEVNPKRAVYTLDKATAVMAILFFYAAVGVNFITLRRLFDSTLAMIATVAQLVTYLFWEYAMSGLPHMLALFLFSVVCYALVRAVQAEEEETPAWLWVIVAGVGFGLMALTHPVTLWLFIGALAFVLIYFRQRLAYAGAMAGIVILMITPWLVRNYQLTGNPAGISAYSALHGISGSESMIMRSTSPDMLKVNPFPYRIKITEHLADYISNPTAYLGGILAPLFFISLFYLFRRKVLRDFRWALFAMWLVGLLGMAIFATEDIASSVKAADVQILFIPLFTGYGIAFILTLWGSLNIHTGYLKKALIGAIVLAAAMPLIANCLQRKSPLWWPPYAPPYMTFLSRWTDEKEAIVSDMPWAVGWYSDRTGVWMPNSLKDFIGYYDYGQIGSPFGGLFLTPITGNAQFLSSIVKGEYKDWAPVILRSANVRDLPFTKAIPFGPDGLCIFYSNYERWSRTEADQLKEMSEEKKEGDKKDGDKKDGEKKEAAEGADKEEKEE